MSKIIIFGGTTEGRELAQFCADKGISADVSVTTGYGGELLPRSGYIRTLVGKLDERQMSVLFSKENYTAVIDATHPYAKEATANIKAACDETKTQYYRLLRSAEAPCGTVVDSVQEAAEHLNTNDKNVLITTGSKTLHEFTRVNEFSRRLTIRVLPADGIVKHCNEMGFINILVCKGPFSVEQNIEHIRFSGAEILVTKESGAAGGYPEKAEATRLCGIELVTVRRPFEEGYTPEEIHKILVEL